ncbi:MAG: NAD-dependent epimerase/dehydratase family protein [Paraburkholderia sp.]|uniref:NAD(P)H-binding protein n=1 Tax=Paraburkholderia sp. TaxID=1926495 RepID=UPI0012084611|nr:NAD(P)H-binding protein [Paraburkholderia sp.]TAL97681.1 MAG: NAD-dependent epimerase/dehydratase family protein [Paraburkholderia sp.]
MPANIASVDPVAGSASRKRTVLLVGATGLVGSACLKLLARDPRVGEVRSLVRRSSGAGIAGHANRVIEQVVDFDRLDSLPGTDDLFAVDAVICALGTTIRTAGTQAAFRKVDHEYPLRVGALARRHGASRYALVSAIGASPQARTFYSRVKGEVEAGVLGLGFPAVTIVRPSFLMGERVESRPLESIARRFGVILPLKWRSIAADDVAHALVAAASGDTQGVTIIENDALHRGAGAL